MTEPAKQQLTGPEGNGHGAGVLSYQELEEMVHTLLAKAEELEAENHRLRAELEGTDYGD